MCLETPGKGAFPGDTAPGLQERPRGLGGISPQLGATTPPPLVYDVRVEFQLNRAVSAARPLLVFPSCLTYTYLPIYLPTFLFLLFNFFVSFCPCWEQPCSCVICLKIYISKDKKSQPVKETGFREMFLAGRGVIGIIIDATRMTPSSSFLLSGRAGLICCWSWSGYGFWYMGGCLCFVFSVFFLLSAGVAFRFLIYLITTTSVADIAC